MAKLYREGRKKEWKEINDLKSNADYKEFRKIHEKYNKIYGTKKRH